MFKVLFGVIIWPLACAFASLFYFMFPRLDSIATGMMGGIFASCVIMIIYTAAEYE
jgi:hypothetical protein